MCKGKIGETTESCPYNNVEIIVKFVFFKDVGAGLRACPIKISFS